MGRLNLTKKKKKLHETRVSKCRYRVLKRHYRALEFFFLIFNFQFVITQLFKNRVLNRNSIFRKSSFKRGAFP